MIYTYTEEWSVCSERSTPVQTCSSRIKRLFISLCIMSSKRVQRF